MDDQRGYTGFPSPAEEYRLPSLDLQSLLAPRARTTYFVRFHGDAMTGENIFDQDLLVVERMLSYSSGQIVLAFVDGQRLVRRLERRDESLYLCPANSHYPEIELGEEIQIFGRVMHSITHHLKIKQHLPTAS
jgi:DNA polymerase V